MATLVTGGTGFVGGALVRALVERGESVRVLARRTSRTEPLDALGVEVAYGDLLEPSSLDAALEGCDRLFHLAAVYEFWVPDNGAMQRTQVEGTRNTLEAALRAGVERVVYTSSTLTIGPPKGEVGTETTTHRGYFLGDYERAKYEAEQVVWSYTERGLPIVIVNPSGVYGPGDLKPSGQGFLLLLNGKLPALFPGLPYGIVYIDDVAEAHVRAMEEGRIGERYIISERNVTAVELYGTACRLAGVRMPSVWPAPIFRVIAELGEFTSRFTRRPPLLERDVYRFSIHGSAMDGSKAARELGIEYTPLEEGLPKALAWYWEQGLLKQKPAFLEADAAAVG